jgi:hypothetical protein
MKAARVAEGGALWEFSFAKGLGRLHGFGPFVRQLRQAG